MDPKLAREYLAAAIEDGDPKVMLPALRTVAEAAGWQLVRVRGSHHQFKHLAKPGLVTVPHPKKDLGTGLVKSILKQAGIRPRR